jgi:hypothetical protein
LSKINFSTRPNGNGVLTHDGSVKSAVFQFTQRLINVEIGQTKEAFSSHYFLKTMLLILIAFFVIIK